MENKRIGQLLIEGGYVTPEHLEEALRIQETKDNRICSILMELGYLSEESFQEFLSGVPGTAGINLSMFVIEKEVIDLVPEELARRLELLPIGKIGNILTVGMVCPLDKVAQQELGHLTGLQIRPVLCSRTAVLEAIEEHYKKPEEEDSDSKKE